MDRRRFLAASAAFLAGCFGGGGPRLPRILPRPSESPAPENRPEPTIGLNVHSATALAMLPHLQALRIRHVRTSWHPWNQAEDWSWLPKYRSAGIDVLPLVYGGVERLEKLRRAWGDFPAYQIGNEPDGRLPNQHPPTWTEGKMEALKVARFRDAAGDARLVSPGLAWNRAGVTEFLAGMLSVPGAFDVLAIHVYGVHVWGEPLSRCEKVRAAGWAGPLWATEMGVGYREAEYAEADPDLWQEDNWRRALTEDPSRHEYARIYPFQLAHDAGGFGILDAEGEPRAAYRWLQGRR